MPPSTANATGPVDWPTYGFTVDRAGFNPSEQTLAPAKVRSLRQHWSVSLGGGVIDTQPVLAAGVQLGAARTADVVYAGTEAGRVVALDAATGNVIWRRKLGAVRVSSCTDLPEFGITDTAVLDRARGSLYVVGGKGTAYDLDLATGRTKRRWSITTNPTREHVWGGLTLESGVLYVTVAGICDFPTYHGRVVAIATGSGKRVATWYVTGRHGAGGGIWGWGGVSADPLSDAIFAATGNSGTSLGSENARYAERVVSLTRDLHVRASDYPGLPRDDADFGATPLLYRAPGCPSQLAVVNKYGSLYIYDRYGIHKGPVQRVKLGGSVYASGALVGVPAYWPAARTLYVANPEPRGRYQPGVVAFRVTNRCRVGLRWQASGHRGVTSSPTVADGVVYYGDGGGGRVVAFDARTGHRLWTSGRTLHGHPAFNAPSVVNGKVYAGGWDGRVHAYGQ